MRETLSRSTASATTVITADALLAMILRRDGIDAHAITETFVGSAIEALDRVALSALDAALESVPAGPRLAAEFSDAILRRCLQYSLIPNFIRAVRNIAAIDEAMARSEFEDVVLVGGGRLPQAARLVAARRQVRVQTAGASPFQRLTQSIARLRAGRQTRWVGSDFRAIVLEPGFLLTLLARGIWQRATRKPPAATSRDALIVTGDRWTADVVARARDMARSVILAGATQPGRALFRHDARVVTFERWLQPSDAIDGLAAIGSACVEACSPPAAPAVPERFQIAGVSFWPLVARAVQLQVTIWMPLLRGVWALMRRVAQTSPEAVLLTSTDATAYAGALVAAARGTGVPSISIQHGLMGEPNGHSVVRTDVIAAWGPATEPWHRALAPQHARFVVTGNPRFDTFPTASVKPPRDPTRPFTIAVCTGFVAEFSVCASDALNFQLIQATLDWASSRDVRIVHKMHPGEEPDYYRDAAALLGWERPALSMVKDVVLHDLLQSSDVLVTGYSTTVIESVLLGTPAIVCDFEQRRLLPIDRIGGVTLASSIAELHGQLDAHFEGRSDSAPDPADEELRGYVSVLDGNASDRIAALTRRQ